jgi:lipopolysaccharide transport system ATP-binding protein
MAVAIKVENLSKAYQLGEIGTGTISRDLERWWAKKRGKEDPFMRIGEVNDRTVKTGSDIVWSLKDLDFEINKGDAVGIIGRNGAGKSTLLKILSRVTAPTRGLVKIKGRIASLLEVGTGFHPELTGRENVFLNGAILGMRKKEIRSKFDEIVDFAGVERYIDTPVKRYSSGMYVRLAFSVAAHLESEILVVDEVLAVGDAEFQKKCIGKMGDISHSEGRTILFVSHNMGAINQLCNTAISLSNGEITGRGEAFKVVAGYLNADSNKDSMVDLVSAQIPRTGNRKVQFLKVSLARSGQMQTNRYFSVGDDIHIQFSMKINKTNQREIKTAVELRTAEGLRLANMIDADSGFQVAGKENDIMTYEVIMKDVRLYPDTYLLSLYAGDMSSTETYDYLPDCISFEIIDGGIYTTRTLPRSAGLLFFTPQWNSVNGSGNE